MVTICTFQFATEFNTFMGIVDDNLKVSLEQPVQVTSKKE